MNFLKKRKLKKTVKEYLHAAQHARHMREDIADPKLLQKLTDAEQAVLSLKKSGGDALEKALEHLIKKTDELYPIKNNSGIRENVEVIIVALAAAMAIRAFFFQPFQIPTGSMQPTLNGITTEYQEAPTLTDYQPFKFFKWLLTGASYKEIKAKASGKPILTKMTRDFFVIEISHVPHKIPIYLKDFLLERGWNQWRCKKEYYKKGDKMVRTKVITGDHILVNKMKYNFTKPQRGDIAVFDTRHINHPEVRKDTFYIKRIIGLPNETVQIQNREIVVNGKVVRHPPIFKKMVTDPNYAGHSYKGMLSSPDDKIKLNSDEYLMMGDNTEHSLDGRFFGAVQRRDFQGNAFMVYWPFRSHWGLVH